MSKRLLVLGALLLGAPTVAQQDEGNVFFSLSSDKTYDPDDTPAIQLWGQGVRKLTFRLYRVNDPVKFFENLPDDHRFGGRGPQSRSLSRIERLRQWKRGLRARTKELVKAQFNSDGREQFRQSFINEAPRKATKPVVTNYAEIPVLNPQQLVASWEQPFNPKNRWESATVPIPTKGKGLFLVEATNGPLFAYTIISVTDIAVITKSSPGRLLARVVSRSTGAPLADAPVTVFASDKSKRYLDSKTNRDGFAEAKIADEKPESALVVTRVKDDFAAVSMYGGSLSTADDENLMAYVYTDRPVYRPGHTVYYKAVVRSRQAGGYAIPAGSDVRVEVDDADGKNIHRATPKLSAMGTLHGKLEIPANAPLGHYSVQVRVGERVQSGTFQVQEYKKPEYEVRVTPKERRVMQGAALQAVIDSRYFYGEPVAGAKVTYVVHRSRYWPPYYEMDEEATPDDSPFANREQVLEQDGTLDEDGKLTVTVPTERAEHDLSYRIEARVTDAAGREISGAGFVVATVAQYMVNISSDRYVYEPGAMATFRLEAKDYDGSPVANVRFVVDLATYSWRDKAQTPLGRAEATSGADGRASVQMRVQAGSLRATVRSTTADGRVVQDNSFVWVSGSAVSWGADEEQVRIVADKKSYKAGETARVMIAAGVGTHLWVTSEGAAVHDSRFVTSKDATVTVDIPVQRRYAPNFYVNVSAIKDGVLISGSLLVKVPPEEFKLDVKLVPSKSEYKPGEAATYTLEAKDSTGKPVEGEFSVGVVDEAIYSVEPETVKDPVPFFYGREWNRVNTESSLSYSFHGEAGRRRMQLARVRPFTPRAQLKPERLVTPKIRKAFPDTAFWAADVRTDASGRAQVNLAFPDALTTWRATARGVTADHKVGAAVSKVIARKYLMVRLAVPRFFRLGDEMTVSAIAQNYLANDKKVRVSLEAKGLQVIQGGTQDVLVPSKGTASVDFRVKVPPGAEAVLLAKALSDEESDALELTLPIRPYGVKMSQSKGVSMTSNGQADAVLNFPGDAEASSRVLEIRAAPSVAGTMFDALDYLTAFPYGCTEQTMSSFLPNVIVSHAVESLKLKSRVNEKDLAKKVRAGLDRLYDFQHDDGGWGWWKEDDSDYFMTAYVVAGLSQARASGHDVVRTSVDRGVKWLATAKDRNGNAYRTAYAAYAMALAGRADRAMLTRLHDERASMEPYALALLGLALEQAKDSRADEVAGLLESKAKSSDTEAWWDAQHDYLLDIVSDASPEATAFAVKLLSAKRPSSTLLPKAALWLVNHRRGGYYWDSTKQTAMVIHGLTDYLKMSGELNPNFAFLVYVNDRQVLSQKFTSSDALAPAVVKLTGDELATGNNRVRVVRSGEGRLYWSAQANYFSTSTRLASRGDRKLNIEREYFRMAPANRGGKIVYDLEPLSGPVLQGDLLAVKLSVTGGEWRYLLIEDPIPAGAEIVKRDDLYEFGTKPPWWTYWFTRREYRDDRAAFFQTYFSRGNGDYFYLLKVVNPGNFRISPARVEPMYQPEYFATSDSSTLEAKRR